MENSTANVFANSAIKKENLKQWQYVSTGSKTKKHKKYHMKKAA